MSNFNLGDFKGNQISYRVFKGVKYFDASQMGKIVNKKPDNFLRNKQTNDFIRVLSCFSDLRSCDIVKVENGKGTWMHEKLALKYAAWLLPEFELWIYEKIEDLLKNGKTTLSNEAQEIAPASQLVLFEHQKAIYREFEELLKSHSIYSLGNAVRTAAELTDKFNIQKRFYVRSKLPSREMADAFTKHMMQINLKVKQAKQDHIFQGLINGTKEPSKILIV
ncbi:MAG: KilA-N domain-containing protein [Saprospiraceae bacterium]